MRFLSVLPAVVLLSPPPPPPLPRLVIPLSSSPHSLPLTSPNTVLCLAVRRRDVRAAWPLASSAGGSSTSQPTSERSENWKLLKAKHTHTDSQPRKHTRRIVWVRKHTFWFLMINLTYVQIIHLTRRRSDSLLQSGAAWLSFPLTYPSPLFLLPIFPLCELHVLQVCICRSALALTYWRWIIEFLTAAPRPASLPELPGFE